MGIHASSRLVEIPFYARISQPERIFSGFLTIVVRNSNDGNEATDDFMTRLDDQYSNAQTRNMDDYAPFSASNADPGHSSFKFSTAIDTDSNLLLSANGGTSDFNSTFDTDAFSNIDWVSIETNDDDSGAVDPISGSGGKLVFTPQASGSSANEQGIKLKRSLSMGTTGLASDQNLWGHTYIGKVYRVIVNFLVGSNVDNSDELFIKAIFTNGDSITSAAAAASSFGSAGNHSLDFVIPSNANLDEIHFYILDPTNHGGANDKITINSVSLYHVKNRDRTNYGHSIGDYDVLVYHVTGACHLNSLVTPYKLDGTNAYYTKSELQGASYPDESGNTWAKYIDHPACQNFVKFTLISRHNNAYDHQVWDNTAYSLNSRNSTGSGDNDQGKSGINIWERGTNTTMSYFNYGMPANTINIEDQYSTGMVDKDMYLYKDSSSLTLGADDATTGLTRHRKQIFSTASASYKETVGYDQSLKTIGEDLRSGTKHIGIDGFRGNNTYFAPVHGVDIYAAHPFVLSRANDAGTTQGSGTSLYGILIRNTVHDTSFWQLVVNVKLLAFNSGAGTNVTNDYAFFKNRININFQPSGETQNILFSTSSHTT